MYTLTVTTHTEIKKSWNFIELAYACDMFSFAITCEDCANAVIIDGMTGELVKEWDYKDGLTIFTDHGEIHLFI